MFDILGKICAEREFAHAISVGIETEFLHIDKPKGHNKLYLNDIMSKQGKENISVLNVICSRGWLSS